MQESSVASEELPVVTEVLLTANGTNFYVLTVAGEHGIASDGDRNEDGTETVSEEDQPAYLANVTIPQDTLNSIREM